METSSALSADCATLHLPTETDGDSHGDVRCVCQQVSGRRMTLISDVGVPKLAYASIEYNDAMFLGEVIACTQECDDRWRVEIKVDQILNGLESLMNLRRSLLGESAPDRHTVSMG